MKKIIKDKELREKMNKGVKLLCETVKTTLGPKSSNVIILETLHTPYITNDGVTIAENINSTDKSINTIMALTKEASINTDTLVGDGTTTTLVLLESIYNNGVKLLKKENGIIIKEKLNKELNIIIDKIKSLSKKVEEKDIKNVALNSSNDIEIANNIVSSIKEIDNINNITINISNSDQTIINKKNGYIIETLLGSPYFLKDKDSLNLINPYIFIYNDVIVDLESISIIINEIVKTKSNLVIIANDYTELVINQILNLYLENNITIIPLKTPDYGVLRLKTLEDISLISNGFISENITLEHLGKVPNIIINKDETIINFYKNKLIEEKIKELENSTDITTIKRLSLLKGKSIEILVGGITDLEKKEKKMRYTDAINAVFNLKDGVLPGSGISLYEISESIKSKNKIDNILKKALKTPFNQIMKNSGLNKNKIIKEIKKSNYKKLYNVKNEKFELISETSVIDPTKIVINSLKNAVSIASMLLTTNALVINENDTNTLEDL